MVIDTFVYEGKKYPVKHVQIDNWGETVPVSIMEFEDALLNDDCLPKGEVEEDIDNCIYCYVDEDTFNMPDDELSKYIIENFC